MKIKIGKVVIDSMDDPSIHKEQLEKKYNVSCMNHDTEIKVQCELDNYAVLHYEKRLLISVEKRQTWTTTGCWVDNDVKYIPTVEIDRYERKRSWLGRWKDD